MKRNPIFMILVAVAATGILSGCSLFRKNSDYYTKAAETRPLEVPPDLDTPPTTNELVVPRAGSPAGAYAVPPASAADGSTPPTMAATPAGTNVAGADLHVSDSVQNTWQRVGLALERAQIGTLSARDEAAHTYTLEFDSTVETPAPAPEHHWYSRILHPFGGGGGSTKIEKVRRSLVVRVGEDTGGARVRVEGDTSDKATADAARRVLQVLTDRLS